ncbi:MAG: CpsD/CapB family tyrosine-protein kinase [Candidatus Omnitrophica bacterium]|jgi:capsular exopolysaccharide synthesis family protein|nr:CpsD/CapB family tyrosine-protein kinase [Syntrophorhabdaceae bacterium]MDD5424018.1 CpsD/CapB family tyrosine-protein kinase [Candidatus Omnitrophota bacterium]
MQNNGNGINKLNEALKRAADEKGKAFQAAPASPLNNPPVEERAGNEMPPAARTEISLSSGISKKIVAFHNPGSPIAEQFRVVSTHIFCPEREGKLKAIVITSCSNEEGKSVAAANLAIVTAQNSGKPTLLIDCNFRKPSIGGLMGASLDKGLGDLLSGRAEAQDITAASEIKNLSIISAGNPSGNPTELLSSQKMKDFLFELKGKYDRIILDTPAVIPFSDPRILSHIVDGTVLVVRAGRTRREVVARAESVLKSVGANIIGYVLTGIEYHIPEYIHRHL